MLKLCLHILSTLKENVFVANYHLNKKPILGNYSISKGNTHLQEVIGFSLFSCAIPLGEEKDFSERIQASCQTSLPAVGSSADLGGGELKILRLGDDQAFVLGRNANDAPEQILRNYGLYKGGYLTEQTGGWVCLKISGTDVHDILERTCSLDLHLSVFPVGGVVRTVMEHMGVILYREKEAQFLLLSASSSAVSFVHLLTTSIDNISNEEAVPH